MMFEVMAFKFCPIYIKHQTFNFKLEKRGLHATALFFVPFILRSAGESSLSSGKRRGLLLFAVYYTQRNDSDDCR